MSQCPPCFPLCSGTPGDGRAAPPRVTTQSGSAARGQGAAQLAALATLARGNILRGCQTRHMWQLGPVRWSRWPVWCGHGSRVGAAGTKMAAQYPAQPSPAQPSGDVSISGQPVPPCWPRRRVHRHCSTHKHCTRVPTFLMWSRATAALVQAVLFSSPGSVTEITFFFMF